MKKEISLRTNHLLVELYKSGLRGFCFDVWVEKIYACIHICIYRHNFKLQWWKGKKYNDV